MDFMLTIFGIGGPLIFAAALIAGGLFFGLPRKAALWGGAAAAGAALVAWLRRDAVKDERAREAAEEAAEHDRKRKEGRDARWEEKRAGGDPGDIYDRLRERDDQWN